MTVLDWLDRKGMKKQHWTAEGLRRAVEPGVTPVAELELAPIRDRRLPDSRAA